MIPNFSALYLFYSQFWHISLDWKLFKVGRFSQLSQIRLYFHRKKGQWSRMVGSRRFRTFQLSTSITRSFGIFLSHQKFSLWEILQLTQILLYFHRKKRQSSFSVVSRRFPKSHISTSSTRSSDIFLSPKTFQGREIFTTFSNTGLFSPEKRAMV